MVAQEAARIIVNQGIRDFGLAKKKAAERLGLTDRGSLPGNAEIELAVSEHLQLFAGESHSADANSAVNLHVFADSAESVAHALDLRGLNYKPYERRLKSRRDRAETYAGFEFHHGEAAVQATVFPVDGIRQAPISPVDGKPMKRADEKAVRELLQAL